MKKIIILTAFVLSNVFAIAQEASLIKLYSDKKQSTISYTMNHPLHSWVGESKEITSIILSDESKTLITKVAVSVKIASFDSKNANRDSHAIEVLEALKYPTVSFSSNSIKQEGEKYIITGVLTFHGVSQTISFEAEKTMFNNKIEVTGGFTIKMSQYKIESPSLMGIATDDDIKITFKMVY